MQAIKKLAIRNLNRWYFLPGAMHNNIHWKSNYHLMQAYLGEFGQHFGGRAAIQRGNVSLYKTSCNSTYTMPFGKNFMCFKSCYSLTITNKDISSLGLLVVLHLLLMEIFLIALKHFFFRRQWRRKPCCAVLSSVSSVSVSICGWKNL